MNTEQIINALQLLEDFHSKNPKKINHYKGTDERWGDYEYFSHGAGTGTCFSSPDLHDFINDVSSRWDDEC